MRSTTTILVIDSTAEVANVVVDILTDQGYTARAVYDGRRALSVVIKQRPHLILLDTQAYNDKGVMVLADLCDARVIDVPIILMTTDARQAEALLGCRVQEYIEKPFDIDTLLAVVARLVPANESHSNAHSEVGR